MSKKFVLYALTAIILSCLPSQSMAQMSTFSEVTKSFFANSKKYSITSHLIVMSGPDGLTTYNPGESTFTVKSDGFSYRYKDGSGKSYTLSPNIRTVTVLTYNGDVPMPMYILNDGSAVRAIRYEDGKYQVHHYTKNINFGKYIHTQVFTLK